MNECSDSCHASPDWFAPWIIDRLARVRPPDRVAVQVPDWFSFEYSAEAIRELGQECPQLDEVGWRCLMRVVGMPCWLTEVLISVRALGLTATKIGWNASLRLLEEGIPTTSAEVPVQAGEVTEYLSRVMYELTEAAGGCEPEAASKWHAAVDQVLRRDFDGDDLYSLAAKVAAGNPVAHARDLVPKTIEATQWVTTPQMGSFE